MLYLRLDFNRNTLSIQEKMKSLFKIVQHF